MGASLCIWGVTGLFCLIQALCYTELACVIPKAGGDYAYIYDILGPVPAFLTAWLEMLVNCTASLAVLSKSSGLYLLQTADLDCEPWIVTAAAIFLLGLKICAFFVK